MAIEQLTAPLQRKKKIRHVVEGREGKGGIVEQVRMRYLGSQTIIGQGGKGNRSGGYRTITTKKGKKTQRENEMFALEDAARAKIKPIADPDQEQTIERKRAARRRMRGRLGTLLSERGTLG